MPNWRCEPGSQVSLESTVGLLTFSSEWRSHACREFLLANYAEIKKVNPGFPVLIRECAGAEAKLVARYAKGVEKSVSIQGDSAAAIEKKLIGLTSS